MSNKNKNRKPSEGNEGVGGSLFNDLKKDSVKAKKPRKNIYPRRNNKIIRKEDIPEELLEELVYTDELTQIYNRRYFNKKFKEKTIEARKENKPISFIMIDVDHFKGFNDTYGHEKGDEVLVMVASAIKKGAAGQGIPIRYAGDEFCVLLPDIEKPRAVKVAENIRKITGGLEIPAEGSARSLSVTLSVGVSNFPEDTDEPSRLQNIGDEAAYISKKKGRNCVSTIDEHEPETLEAANLYKYFPCKKFVGRDELMKEFIPYIAPGARKERPMVILRGKPDLGKTRILDELYESADKQRCFAFRSMASKLNIGQPFNEILEPITEILKENPEIAGKIVNKLEPDQLQAIIIFLPQLKRYIQSENPLLALNPAEKKECMLHGLARVLTIISEEKPLLIFIDEFQFLNYGTRELFDRVKNQVKAGNVAIFTTLCDRMLSRVNNPELLEFIQKSEHEGNLKQYAVQPLELEQVKTMLNCIIIGVGDREEISRCFYDFSRGFPGKVEEIFKKLIFSDKIRLVKGKLEIDPISSEEMEEYAQSRFTGTNVLEQEVVELLAKASVIDNSITVEVLKNLTDQFSDSEIYQVLEKASKANLLTQSVKDEEVIFEFKDEQVKEQLYSSLEEKEKKDLHVKVAEAEEILNVDNINGVLSKISYHYGKSDETAKALEYMKKLAKEYRELISENAIRVYIGKLPEIKDWGKEKKLDYEQMEKAVKVCKRLKIVINNLDRYPIHSEIVQGSLDATFLELKRLLQEVNILTFSDAEGTLIINNEPPSQEELDSGVEEEFLEILKNANLRGISLRRGITRNEFIDFMKVVLNTTLMMVEEEGGWNNILEKNQISNAQVNQRIFVTMGSKDLMGANRVKERRSKLRETTGNTSKETDFSSGLLSSEQIPGEIKAQIDGIRSQYKNDHQLMELLENLQNMVGSLTQLQKETSEPSTEKLEAQPDEKDQAILSETLEEARRMQYQVKQISQMLEHQHMVVMEKIKESPEVLVQDLDDPDPEVVKQTAAALDSKGRVVIPALYDFIIDSQTLTGRQTALSLLKEMDTNVNRKMLRRLMENTTVSQKVNILEILKELNHVPPDDVFRVFVHDPSARLRRAVLGVIEENPDKKHVNILVECLQDNNEDIVIDAAYSLGRIGDPAAVPYLANLLKKKPIIFNDGRFASQEAVCKVLGQLGGSQALKVLENVIRKTPAIFMLRNKPDQVRASAAYALGYFEPEEVQSLIKQYQNDSSPVI
ncbi:MAG: diguanylate cyclase, partial [Vulcanimicrobiota bacterium]